MNYKELYEQAERRLVLAERALERACEQIIRLQETIQEEEAKLEGLRMRLESEAV